MALLARTLFATKLMVLEPGAGPPVGYSRKSPKSVSWVTVTLMAIALASEGIPQSPAAGKLRVVLAARAGPPEGPGALRVSATRQGVSVKNLPGAQPGNLKEPMRVLQLNLPSALRYSCVYQKVQSSTGSTVIAL